MLALRGSEMFPDFFIPAPCYTNSGNAKQDSRTSNTLTQLETIDEITIMSLNRTDRKGGGWVGGGS